MQTIDVSVYRRGSRLVMEVVGQPMEWVDSVRYAEKPLEFVAKNGITIMVDRDMGFVIPCEAYPKGAICLRGTDAEQWYTPHELDVGDTDAAENLKRNMREALAEFMIKSPWL